MFDIVYFISQIYNRKIVVMDDDNVKEKSPTEKFSNDESKSKNLLIDNKYILIYDDVTYDDVSDLKYNVDDKNDNNDNDVNISEKAFTISKYIKKAQNIKKRYFGTLMIFFVFVIMGNSALSEYFDYKPNQDDKIKKDTRITLFMYLLGWLFFISLIVFAISCIMEYILKTILYFKYDLTYLVDIPVDEEEAIPSTNNDDPDTSNSYYLKKREGKDIGTWFINHSSKLAFIVMIIIAANIMALYGYPVYGVHYVYNPLSIFYPMFGGTENKYAFVGLSGGKIYDQFKGRDVNIGKMSSHLLRLYQLFIIAIFGTLIMNPVILLLFSFLKYFSATPLSIVDGLTVGGRDYPKMELGDMNRLFFRIAQGRCVESGIFGGVVRRIFGNMIGMDSWIMDSYFSNEYLGVVCKQGEYFRRFAWIAFIISMSSSIFLVLPKLFRKMGLDTNIPPSILTGIGSLSLIAYMGSTGKLFGLFDSTPLIGGLVDGSYQNLLDKKSHIEGIANMDNHTKLTINSEIETKVNYGWNLGIYPENPPALVPVQVPTKIDIPNQNTELTGQLGGADPHDMFNRAVTAGTIHLDMYLNKPQDLLSKDKPIDCSDNTRFTGSTGSIRDNDSKTIEQMLRYPEELPGLNKFNDFVQYFTGGSFLTGNTIMLERCGLGDIGIEIKDVEDFIKRYGNVKSEERELCLLMCNKLKYLTSDIKCPKRTNYVDDIKNTLSLPAMINMPNTNVNSNTNANAEKEMVKVTGGFSNISNIDINNAYFPVKLNVRDKGYVHNINRIQVNPFLGKIKIGGKVLSWNEGHLEHYVTRYIEKSKDYGEVSDNEDQSYKKFSGYIYDEDGKPVVINEGGKKRLISKDGKFIDL